MLARGNLAVRPALPTQAHRAGEYLEGIDPWSLSRAQVEVIERLLEAALEGLAAGTKHWTSRRENTKTKVSLNTRIINLYRYS